MKAILHIDLNAIAYNIQQIQLRAPQKKIIAMIKANGYGTDASTLAHFLTHRGVEKLGLALVQEAIFLRNQGVSSPLFVLHAAPSEMQTVVDYNLEIAISSHQELDALMKAAKKKIKVHLHLDTGMKRLGCMPHEALSLAKAIHDHPYLEFEGFMSHFAASDDPQEDDFTLQQKSLFDQTLQTFKKEGIYPRTTHIENSSAAARFAFQDMNTLRLGIALFGIHLSEESAQILNLKPALSLKTHIAALSFCRQGESISYGRTYKASQPLEKIAVLPIGYFDGISQSFSGKGTALIGNNIAPFVGRVCMDFCMINVTHIPEVEIGQEVTLFGSGTHCMKSFATIGGLSPYELMCRFGPRIHRTFIT